jgi:DNA-binding response OmpR family regulator
MRILVVAHEAAVRHAIDAVLTRRGHDLLIASAAYEAHALLLDFPTAPDIAILDIHLPGLSGPAYGLRLREQFPRIRLLLLDGEEALVDLPAGTTVIPKPVQPQMLVNMIEAPPGG